MARGAARKTEPTLILPVGPPAASERARVVDEYGRIAAELEALKPLIARHEQLRQRIAGWYADSDPESGFVVDGAQFSAQIGPKASKRSVSNLPLIFDRLGATKFFSCCSLSLEKLDLVMLPSDQADCVITERAGPRTIRPVPIFAEPAA